MSNFNKLAPKAWGVWVISIFAVVGFGLAGCGGGGGGTGAVVALPGGGGAPPPVVIPPPACVLPATPSITPSVTASRVTGVAPLAVYFDASATVATATTRPFHELGFSWNFGESTGPGIAAWGAGARPTASRNLASGPVAAHVYETPGTYTVCMTVTDGTNTTDAAVVITVDNPDFVFAGAATACVSTSGTFTGCPAGAAQVTTSDFATAMGSITPGNTVRRLLFRRGETWTSPVAGSLTANGPGLIGAFGAGAAPVIQRTGGARILTISSGNTPDLTDWRIMDLELDGLGAPGATHAGVGALGGMNQLTLLRLNVHDVGVGFSFTSSVLDVNNLGGGATPGHDIYDQVAFVDNTITRVLNPGGGNGIFVEAARLMVLGNTISDSTNGEHILRIQSVVKGVISNNSLSNQNALKSVLTLRANAFSAGPCANVTGCGYSEQVVISDNTFAAGLGNLTLAIGLVSPGGIDARVRELIIERNFFTSSASTSQDLAVWIDDSTIRNNIFTTPVGGGRNIVLGVQDGSEPTHRRLRVYNNTSYFAPAAPFRMIRIDALVDDVTVSNNLAYAPNSTTQNLLEDLGGTSVVGAPGTFGNSSNGQILATSPLFTNGSGTFSAPTDFTVAGGSYAVNSGVVVPLFSDFFRVARPLGGTFDRGATEF